MEESARHHFYKCLDDNNYDGGWAHYRLSKLYDDFDPLVADVSSFFFFVYFYNACVRCCVFSKFFFSVFSYEDIFL